MDHRSVRAQGESRERALVPAAHEIPIRVLRGRRVMLDEDLGPLYGVSTGRLNEAVDRNLSRFPPDFLFRLTAEETAALKSRSAISKTGRGGRRRSTPRAFTQEGVAMLSSVLRSQRAIAVNIEIMRAFVLLRRLQGEHADLAQRIEELERRFDQRFRVVFEALRQLTAPRAPSRRPIGFQPHRPDRRP